MEVLVRQEVEADYDSVYQMVKSAFETMALASENGQDLVNRLGMSPAFIPEL